MTRMLAPFATRLPRGWNDFEREMEDKMRQMFDWDWDDGVESGLSFAPSLNVAETDRNYEISVDLPGMKPEELKIELKDDALWITGERKKEMEEKEKTYHRVERRYGAFRRVIRLGTNVDPKTIDARYQDGVLTISVAKTEAARPKQIEIHT